MSEIIQIIESHSSLPRALAEKFVDEEIPYKGYYLTPLLIAVKLNNFNTSKVLLELGANVNQKDRLINSYDKRYASDGLSSIHHASMNRVVAINKINTNFRYEYFTEPVENRASVAQCHRHG